MINAALYTDAYSAAQKDSLLVDQLERLQDFLRRLADLDRCYRALLVTHVASGAQRMELDTLSHRYLSNVYRACEALLNGSSQVERQVFKFQFKQETDASPGIIQINPTTTRRPAL